MVLFCTTSPEIKVRSGLAVLNGYYQYHAVPGNLARLTAFRERVCRYWR